MTRRGSATVVAFAFLAAAVVAASGCGGGGSGGSSPAATTKVAIVPNVEGAKMTDAVVQLVNAHLCVRLKLDKKLPPSRVARQSPRFGISVAPWRLVTIVVGVPPHKKNADKVRVSVAVRGSRHRCPPIRAVVRFPRKHA